MAWRGGSVVAIIPARLGSTRLPRKALADETGKPLVVHVCERARAASSVERVVVATDSEEIAAAVRGAGFEGVLTSPDHPNGTSRLVEASKALGLSSSDVVVNVQGDEPEIEGGVIDAAVGALRVEPGSAYGADSGRRRAAVGTVASPISGSEADDPNIVKVVIGRPAKGLDVAPALYFSRARIPCEREAGGGARWLRHVGVYAYTVEALGRYTQMDEGMLERAERLEQLRWLEFGQIVGVAVHESSHAGIDTPEQYRAFVARWRARHGG